MGDKIKPWHDRKPKHGSKERKGKRKQSPNTKDINCDSYPRVDDKSLDEYDPADYSDRWET